MENDENRGERLDKISLVLDTSVFVNPETRKDFGETPKEAFENFVSMVAPMKWIKMYMAPSAWEELMNFVGEASPLSEIRVIKRSPRIQEETIPVKFMYDFIEDMRDRINKGLRIVEKGVRSEHTDENIRKLRNEYREALRHGIIDSIADLDTLMLAMEIDGILITMDEGMIRWAKKLGVPYVNAKKIRKIIDLFVEKDNIKSGTMSK